MYLNFKEDIEYDKLLKPAQIIKNGGLVIFPTETVYGIGTNALDSKAVKKLYEVKKRPYEKPISLLVNSIEMIENIAKDITKLEYELIKNFFPGPLTIILKKKENISNIVTANKETVGVRMPQNDIALKLIEYAGVPIATPSANISGKPSGTNMKDIIKKKKKKVEYFIDNGPSKIGQASTIVQIIDETPYILRKGAISELEIKKVIDKKRLQM